MGAGEPARKPDEMPAGFTYNGLASCPGGEV